MTIIAKFKQNSNKGGSLNVKADQPIDVTMDATVDKNKLITLLGQTVCEKNKPNSHELIASAQIKKRFHHSVASRTIMFST